MYLKEEHKVIFSKLLTRLKNSYILTGAIAKRVKHIFITNSFVFEFNGLGSRLLT